MFTKRQTTDCVLGLSFAYQALMFHGGYATAHEMHGRESSVTLAAIGLTTEALSIACTKDPIDGAMLGGFGIILLEGAPGYELGRGIYHLTHPGRP